MRFLAAGLMGVVLLTISQTSAQAVQEIVVAIRYLQAEGTSHAQLFLYREDGKLVRQLTKDDSGQMMNPVFAPDGASIVFKLQKGRQTEFWSVKPKGDHLQKLDAAPAWYMENKGSPCFHEPATVAKLDDMLHTDEHFTTPDGTQELTLKHSTKAEEEDPNFEMWQYGKHFQVRDVKTGNGTEAGSMAGFFGLYGVLHLGENPDSVFLIEPPLRLAFFFMHLDSTAGDTVLALDLNGLRFTCLSPNWATPFPLAGEPAFLTLTELRYVTIPGSTRTANCSCVEHWDGNLVKVRYSREGTASICYGASMYRPGKTPAVITILLHGE